VNTKNEKGDDQARDFEIWASDRIDYTVTVRARTEEEALIKFADGDFHTRDVVEHERYLHDGGEVANEVLDGS
jgi:hypothetical protein